ncbi:hypothetical protein SEA_SCOOBYDOOBYDOO_49 [Mycobacterium phage ScoobyDoobyDoo]|nr:hypothetical protein SEA_SCOOBYDOOBYDOO_49 [Mycobacterium phage ScoobyDoobyDoo]
MTDTRTYDVSVAFRVPAEFRENPFEYREQIENLMSEAGWPHVHSAGLGCGYGDLAWQIRTDNFELIDAMAILIDRIGKEMATLRVQEVVPMTPDQIEAEEYREQRLAELRANGGLDEWLERDTAERMDAAYAKVMSYKPTMDATALHMWAQDLIETITGEFKMEDHL